MSKLRIGAVGKRSYAHALDFTSSTSSNFSVVQPLFHRLLQPQETFSATIKQMVRTLPMPWPTFADINVRNNVCFVPIESVYPQFAALMSGQPYTNQSGTQIVPKAVPRIAIYVLGNLFFNMSSSGLNTGPDALAEQVATFTNVVNGNLVFDGERTTSYFTIRNYIETFGPLIEKGDNNLVLLGDTEETNVYLYNRMAVALAKRVLAKELEIEEAERLYQIYAFGSVIADIPQGGIVNASYTNDAAGFIAADNASDYTAVYYTSASNNSTSCYRLTERGKNLWKILYGLGYQVSLDNQQDVSLLPLIAFYKAYYDLFVPVRSKDFNSTACYSVIQLSQQSSAMTIDTFSKLTASTVLKNFFIELSQCYTTHDGNFVSLHTPTTDNNAPITNTLGAGLVAPSVGTAANVAQDITQTSYQSDAGVTTPSQPLDVQGAISTATTKNAAPILATGDNITAYDIKWLMWAQKYLNRDSIIGNRIDTYLRSHFDSNVYNFVFNRTHSIAQNSMQVNISDVDATADTQTTGDNNLSKYLGSYAGKALAGGDLSFKYKTDCYGYLFVITYVEPSGQLAQGIDLSLLARDKYTFPCAEYDGLGYECTPYAFVFDDNGYSLRNDSYNQKNEQNGIKIDATSGFGFVPRMSGFKYAKNILNGDFSRKSKRTTYQSLYGDRYLTARSRSADGKSINFNAPPVASAAWRYVDRYPYISGYDRMFYDMGDVSNVNADGTSYDDNFLIHSVIHATSINKLRPISESYDTRVKEDDDTIIVSNN